MLQDTLSEVRKLFAPLQLKVFVKDINNFMEGRNKELAGMAGKVLKSIACEVQEKGLKLSITEGEKDVKSKVIASCGHLEETFQECSKREGVGLATSVESLGVDLKTRTKQLGAKEEARRKKCDVTFSLIRKFRVFPVFFSLSTGARKLLTVGLVLARVCGGQAVGICHTECLMWRRQMAAAAGNQIPEGSGE